MSKPVQMWAVFNRNGELLPSTVKEKQHTAITRAELYANQYWRVMETQGYTVRRVEVREVDHAD